MNHADSRFARRVGDRPFTELLATVGCCACHAPLSKTKDHLVRDKHDTLRFFAVDLFQGF